MEMLRVEDVKFSYSESQKFFSGLRIQFNKGEFISVIGRNGSGKSTFIKLLSGVLIPNSGNIYFNNKKINSYSPKELAKMLSYLPQFGLPLYEDLSVMEFLLMGRYASKNFFDFGYSVNEKEIIKESARLTGTEELLKYKLSGLSGGERQKVLITLSMVQLDITSNLENKVLIIDEPLTYLDIANQLEIFELLYKLNSKHKLTIIAVTHDLNISLKYSGKSLLLENGKIAIYDKTENVINIMNIHRYFNVNTKIITEDNLNQIFYVN